MNHVEIFKGWPPRDAPSKLIQLWYKTFPPDHGGQAETKNPTVLSNKTSTAWSCAEDQILENKIFGTGLKYICNERLLKYFSEIYLPDRENTWLIGSGRRVFSTLQLGVSPAVDFEREEESTEFKSMYSTRSPLPLIDTDKCCLDPHSRVNRASEENSFSECLAPN